MLRSLHIKNLAIVDETDIVFGPGLNVLTGETGAGKSILLGGILLGLGGRVQKHLLPENGAPTIVELCFEVPDAGTLDALRALGIHPEDDGTILIRRRIEEGRSTLRVNDETFTAGAVREAAGLLLDLYGQEEHESLRGTKKQLALIDEYGGTALLKLRAETGKAYAAMKDAAAKTEALSIGEEERQRRIDLLRFETEEIRNADIRPGEEAQLEDEMRLLSHAEKISEAAGTAYALSGYESGAGGDSVGKALLAMERVREYSEELASLTDELAEIDSLLNDFNRDLSGFLDTFGVDEERYAEVTQRLDEIRHLTRKFGGSEESVLRALDEKDEELAQLETLDEAREAAQKQMNAAKQRLAEQAAALTEERKRSAEAFSAAVIRELSDLNFPKVDFAAELRQEGPVRADGADSAELMISLNPGSGRKPLKDTVSGGELSRIMLAVKAIFAQKEEAGTLFFDEIDAGISGRTAQKVAEKLCKVAKERQVLCITHLPQIAAMANQHFLIEKETGENYTHSGIRLLKEEETVLELARMIGGTAVTEQVIRSAQEMKALSEARKAEL